MPDRLRAAGLALGGVALGLLVAIALAGPRVAVAADPVAPPPLLFADDAPLTRNTDVKLGFVRQPLDGVWGGDIAEYRASNDAALSGGILVDGVSVPEYDWWTLAPGPDGPRTIYGQVKYASGLWSPVASLALTLATSPSSSVAFDMDGMIDTPSGADFHERSTTPADRIFAWPSSTTASLHDVIRVADAKWNVMLATPGVDLAPGAYTVDPPAGGECGPRCAEIGTIPGRTCMATGGTFTIQALTFTAEGDVATVDADFHLTCAGFDMSGSIRYGVSRPIQAIDQDVQQLLFADFVPIAETSDPTSVTLTNIGTAPTTLGGAALTGTDAEDFAIVDDGCSSEVLAVGESCQVGVELTPSGIGQRRASLEIPDGTPRGSRRLMVQGYGVSPTSIDVSVAAPAFGPADAAITVTISPPDAGGPLLLVDGEQAFGPTDVIDPGPPSRVFTFHRTLTPGTHTIEASLQEAPYYLGSAATPVHVTVGTRTSLTLSTATDDGVAAGESATLLASLLTGASIPGGTLQIVDDATHDVLVSGPVSGSNPSISVAVTRPLGSHAFSATYTPPSPDIQAATDDYDMTVVAGTRPETVMDDSTLYRREFTVVSAFSSPDSGVTFECRVLPSNVWYPCVSPSLFTQNNAGTYSILVRATRANGLADRTPAQRTWIIDLTPPDPGSIVIQGGQACVGTRSVSLVAGGATDATGIDHLGLANKAKAPYAKRSATTPQHWKLSRGDGVKHVYAKWWDRAGNATAPRTDAIKLDTTAPRTSHLRVSVSGTRSSRHVTLAWRGSDATCGVARYRVQVSRDGGAWTSAEIVVTGKHATLRVPAGHSYRFRVRAIDKVGLAGAWTRSSAIPVR